MLTASREYAERLCTSSPRINPEEDLYFEDDEELNDDEYWDLDELGIDPEEFYDLCRNSFSHKHLLPIS